MPCGWATLGVGSGPTSCNVIILPCRQDGSPWVPSGWQIDIQWHIQHGTLIYFDGPSGPYGPFTTGGVSYTYYKICEFAKLFPNHQFSSLAYNGDGSLTVHGVYCGCPQWKGTPPSEYDDECGATVPVPPSEGEDIPPAENNWNQGQGGRRRGSGGYDGRDKTIDARGFRLNEHWEEPQASKIRFLPQIENMDDDGPEPVIHPDIRYDKYGRMSVRIPGAAHGHTLIMPSSTGVQHAYGNGGYSGVNGNAKLPPVMTNSALTLWGDEDDGETTYGTQLNLGVMLPGTLNPRDGLVIKRTGQTTAGLFMTDEDGAPDNTRKFSIGDYSIPMADGSADQVLKTDGNGDVSWQDDAASAGDVEAAGGNDWGSAGRVMVSSDTDKSIDDSDLAYASGIIQRVSGAMQYSAPSGQRIDVDQQSTGGIIGLGAARTTQRYILIGQQFSNSGAQVMIRGQSFSYFSSAETLTGDLNNSARAQSKIFTVAAERSITGWIAQDVGSFAADKEGQFLLVGNSSSSTHNIIFVGESASSTDVNRFAADYILKPGESALWVYHAARWRQIGARPIADNIEFTPGSDISATNVQAAIQEVFDAITPGETDHGNLDGLADDDHTQYHNNARGDARYYTETELDAGQLDNRYYTETEVDAFFAGLGDLATLDTVDTTEIDDEAVTHAKYQHINQNEFLGRVAAGTGDVGALTATQVRTALQVLTSSQIAASYLQLSNHVPMGEWDNIVQGGQLEGSTGTEVVLSESLGSNQMRGLEVDVIAWDTENAQAARLFSLVGIKEVSNTLTIDHQAALQAYNNTGLSTISITINGSNQLVVDLNNGGENPVLYSVRVRGHSAQGSTWALPFEG